MTEVRARWPGLVRRVARRFSERRRYYRNPARYWNARLERLGDSLQGVGSIGETAAANEADYAAKWDVLGPELERLHSAGARTLLDAGAGIGYFSSRAASIGFEVDAVDFSSTAVERLRRLDTGIRRVYFSSIAEFAARQAYDVVICIDVLFHVVDDDLWKRSLHRLGALTAHDGVLVVQETLAAESAPRSDGSLRGREHTRWRTLTVYHAQLPDWDIAKHIRFALPHEGAKKDMLVFKRIEFALPNDNGMLNGGTDKRK
jgi:2-polyprenyl-3-methyl-5-hydroxy-6-metoxy-1,4-benzoquinol methylase